MCIDLRRPAGIRAAPRSGNPAPAATDSEVGWSGMDVASPEPAVPRGGHLSAARGWSHCGTGVPTRSPAARLRRPVVATPAFILRRLCRASFR